MTVSVRSDSADKLTTIDDNDLLALIKDKRDMMALTELYQRYQPLLGRFLYRRVSDAEAIEEIYNDVMLSIWQKTGSFRGDSKVST